MVDRNYILTGFGLQQVKPIIYRNSLGDPLGQRDINYPDQEDEDTVGFTIGADDNADISILGTPVWANLKLRIDGDDPGLYFDTVLLTISQSKTIIKTSIQGRNGTVKEYINDGDYIVNIKGLLHTSAPDVYPLEQVNDLVRLLKASRPLEVISDYLRLLEIDLLVVEDYQLMQREGFTNTQLFEINAVSDLSINFLEDDQIN